MKLQISNNYLGYRLSDGSFHVIQGGTCYDIKALENLRKKMQKDYTHTLEVITL